MRAGHRTILGVLMPCTLSLMLISPASALQPIDDARGWSGFIIGGIGYTSISSNFLAGHRIIDIGHPTVDSIHQRAERDDTFHPVATGEIRYTFGNGLQAFLGTSLEDSVTLDGVTQLGVRRDVGARGTVQAGFLLTGIKTKAWEDPYAEGVEREETERDAKGARLQWARVMGSEFEMTLSYREISFDTERSGEGVLSIDCDLGCQNLLRRDGDQYSFEIAHVFRLGGGRNHQLRPSLRYVLEDRKGDAVAGESYHFKLSYAYAQPSYVLTGNVLFASTRRDGQNPLFGRKTDADQLALDLSLFYRIPNRDGLWHAVGNIRWGEVDSNVRFHDSDLFMVSLGLMYRFGTS